MFIEYATVGNWTLQLGSLQFMATTEPLLPGEVAPTFERRTYPCGTQRATVWNITMFRWRLILERVPAGTR